MLEDLRRSLRQSRAPGTVAVAVVVAVAETAAGIVAALLASEVTAGLPGGTYLFAVPLAATALVSMLVWLPVSAFVLAGFYGVLGESPDSVRGSLRAFGRIGRREYRRYLSAAVVSALLGVAVLLAVWVVLVAGYLAASTGFDYARYANGARFAANPIWGVSVTAVLLVFAGFVSRTAFAFTGPLVVRTDVDARRAPLAALQFLREQPRTALPTAAVAAAVFVLPTAGGRLVFGATKPPEPTWASEVSQYHHDLLWATVTALATMLVLSAVVRALVGPLLVRTTDRHADPPSGVSLSPEIFDFRDDEGRGASLEPRSLAPGRRATAIAAVVLLVGASATAVRVADVHPHSPPEAGINLQQAPEDVYAASVDLTVRTGRRVNETVVTRYPNGTVTERVTFATAWDPGDGQATVTVKHVYDEPTTVYFSERAYALQQPGTLDLPTQRGVIGRTVNGWLVVTAPIYAAMDKPGVFSSSDTYRRDGLDLRVVERTPSRLVFGANGTEVARLSELHGSELYDFREARFRAVVDPDTGYLRSIRLTGVRVEHNDSGVVVERMRRTDTVTYRDVGSTDIERPTIGTPSPLELFWDVLAY